MPTKKMKANKVKAGEVLIFTNGCYSDYTLQFVGVVFRDFDIEEQKQEFMKNFPLEEDREKFIKYGKYETRLEASSDMFISFLIKEGLIVSPSATEVHCGDYDFDVDWVRKI